MIEAITKPRAIVLTNGMLAEQGAKTAHGLIRGTERFEVAGVIDYLQAGKDAGEVSRERAARRQEVAVDDDLLADDSQVAESGAQ